MAYFKKGKDNRGEWRWTFCASNGEAIAVASEGYVHRGVGLKRRVLAKLMVLEYLRTESFRTMAEWQAGQAGQPAELGKLETQAREEDSAPGAVAKPEPRAGAKKAAAVAGDTRAEEPLDPDLALWLPKIPP